MKGIVLKSTGSWYEVEAEDGTFWNCKLKGNFKITGIRSTNPIVVGDEVNFEKQKDGQTALINTIFERKNCIVRKATKLSKRTHIIATNVDQALLMVTLAAPRTSTGFIDRFLVTAEAYNIPTRIIFNKTDLFDEAWQEYFLELKQVYENIGYPVIGCSTLKEENLPIIKEWMQDKKSLIVGHSGVGKSTLINKLEPSLHLKTQQISLVHFKGIHTTTFAQMHKLSFGAHIIDTPGIKEFGLVDFKKEELSHFFPEMYAIIDQCQFNNCTHEHEPGCAVKEAVEKNEIASFRYINYLNMLNNVIEDEAEEFN